MKITLRTGTLIACVLIAGCATPASTLSDKTSMDVAMAAMLKASFRDQGAVKLDRLDQDAANSECSAAGTGDLTATRSNAIEQANLTTIKWPSDGKFIGDWKKGEAVAQSGRGATWSDVAGSPNGGNCYNCHQISKQEVSYGTIGPSLLNYGKLRGVSDPSAVSAKAIVQYTWGKIYNAKAYNACSNMPRLGHAGVITEEQIRDVMALLLDPESPVNQ